MLQNGSEKHKPRTIWVLGMKDFYFISSIRPAFHLYVVRSCFEPINEMK